MRNAGAAASARPITPPRSATPRARTTRRGIPVDCSALLPTLDPPRSGVGEVRSQTRSAGVRARIALLACLLATGVLLAAGGSPARPSPRGFEVLAHMDPGNGYAADVWGHGGFAYLGSWHGADCPGAGVRVFDLADPRDPKHVSSF